jgi:hypothetical protein
MDRTRFVQANSLKFDAERLVGIEGKWVRC